MNPLRATAPTNGSTVNREDVIIIGPALEILNDGGDVMVRVPYGTANVLDAGRILFSADRNNVFYTVYES